MVPPNELSTSRQSGARTFPCHGTFVAESVFWRLDVAASHASKRMYVLPVVALLGMLRWEKRHLLMWLAWHR